MTYHCDVCDAELDPGYVPEVDGRGRPVLAICEDCKEMDRVDAEARRAALHAQGADLVEQFQEVLETRIKPLMGH